MLMRLWMFGTGFIYARKGLREMLLMNCFQRSMFVSYFITLHMYIESAVDYCKVFQIYIVLSFLVSLIQHWDTNGCCHQDGPPCVFRFITLLVLVTERGELWVNDLIWWMKIDPLSSPVRQYWWIDRCVRRAFLSVALFMPLSFYMSL